MTRRGGCAVLALMILGATGCATNQEALAEKDRLINERQQENLALKKQLQDARATQDLLQRQFEQKKGELDRVGGEYESAVAERDHLKGELEEAKTATPEPAAASVAVNDPNVEVVARANGEVVLRVSNELSFQPGSATLTKRGQSTLTHVADVLKRHPEFRISVEGHTDDTPLKATKGKWVNNMNLSIARAIQVRDYLSKVSSIDRERMRVVGYGETRPLVPAKTKEARARNRRVEIVLYKGDD